MDFSSPLSLMSFADTVISTIELKAKAKGVSISTHDGNTEQD